MKTFLRFFLGFLCLNIVSAQEMLAPLPGNVLLKDGPKKSAAKRMALNLPFADDFNQTSYYPDPARWEDNFVFINNGFPILPPSVGVATFDGLNPLGKPYSDFNNSFGEADKLTSLPIDLSPYQETDNIYLSFYWQAGGLGDRPDPARDYMVVEFLNSDLEWVEQLKINAPVNVNNFEQSFISVLNAFIHEQFQFRFVAHGNLAGSTDHWNIDYVLLDRNRNPAFESSVSDLAFTQGNGRYFKTYYQMPFKHFYPELLNDTLSVKVKNNFLNTVDIVDNYTVKNLSSGNTIRTYNGPSIDIASLQVLTYDYPRLDLSSVEPTSDTTEIEIRYYFETSAENTSPPFVRANNELTEKITFGNAFAYDDGSAERAYRLINYDFGKIAVKFHATVPDTLRAVRVFFPDFPNYTTSSKDPFFNIAVYKSLDSISGENDEVLYRETFLKKSDFHVPEGEIFNGYAYYTFKPDLNNGKDYLIVNGDFYLAVEHEKNNDVDVGFDMNNPNQQHMWYNVGYGWYASQYPGSIMINALMGKPLDGRFTSVRERKQASVTMKVYPNPTTDILQLQAETAEVFYYRIYNISGTQILSGQAQQSASIAVRELSPGMYILQIEGKNSSFSGLAKFIKQ